MNDEERRRHDKSWNDPPMFTYDQMNQAGAGVGVPKVPLHKRYHAPLAPELSPGYRGPSNPMYGQQPGYGMPQPYGQQQWQNPNQPTPGYPSGWQQSPVPAYPQTHQQQQQTWAHRSPPDIGQGAPYPGSAFPGQPSSTSYGQTLGGQQQSIPLGPQQPSGYPNASVTSVTGSLPSSIPAPGFAPNLTPAPMSSYGQNYYPQQIPGYPPQ